MSQRRLLLISYHFGSDGATGGFRWRAMAEHLASRGWRVDVVTAALDLSSRAGNRYSTAFGDLVEVKTPAWGRWPTRALEWMRSLRRSFRPPAVSEPKTESPPGTVDPASVSLWTPVSARSSLGRLLVLVSGVATMIEEWSWARAAARAARKHARKTSPSVIVVSTPPHVSSVAAVKLARRLDLPAVVDFRDPWVLGLQDGARFGDDELLLALARRRERYVLREAAVVVHNTERARRVVVDALGPQRRAVHVAVANGYDEEQRASPPDSSKFRASFTGWLHPVMDVRVLLAAFGRLRSRHQLTRDEFEVCFMGTADEFGGVSLSGLATAYGLGDVFSLRRRATRAEALLMQQSSAVLCVMDYRHPMAVPMKFYDYVRTCGTMLIVGETPSALADAAAQIGVPVFDGDDVRAIDDYLDVALDRWRARRMKQPMDAQGIFSRDRQSELMDKVLHTAISAHR